MKVAGSWRGGGDVAIPHQTLLLLTLYGPNSFFRRVLLGVKGLTYERRCLFVAAYHDKTECRSLDVSSSGARF